VRALYPRINPAGHAFETRMIAALRSHFEIRSTGVFSVPLPSTDLDPTNSPGVAHEVILSERRPELFSRWQSLAKLKHAYGQWQSERWVPETILVYNLSPIYNTFVRWLRRQPSRPRVVLLLLDSPQLGKRMPAGKRLRYRLKPMIIPDVAMLKYFDACIGLSSDVETYFAASNTPFLWMPGACDPSRAPAALNDKAEAAPVCFGYFGALAGYSGARELAEAFQQSAARAKLRMCGYGKQSETFARLARGDARMRFEGLLPHPDDCLTFGSSCDVLVNPRPPEFGNQNNFPSKLFDYALCGRAILSSRISGVDRVLGPEAFYYETATRPASLIAALETIAGMDRSELRRRGDIIRQRVIAEYNWSVQAARVAKFLAELEQPGRRKRSRTPLNSGQANLNSH
jgi:glycosyltransferase involved in cell wall biosynthesis